MRSVTVEDEETRSMVNQAATPGQAQAMLKNNVREREQEHVELMELERSVQVPSFPESKHVLVFIVIVV